MSQREIISLHVSGRKESNCPLIWLEGEGQVTRKGKELKSFTYVNIHIPYVYEKLIKMSFSCFSKGKGPGKVE